MIKKTIPETVSRLNLARLNTPLQKMTRLSEQLGKEVFFKRDDMTGLELSGNKIRKLEFLLADAKEKGATTILTCGGAQSNHCRATALAAARCGMKSILLLRTSDVANPPAIEGNILLNKMAGAEIIWISSEEYNDRDAIFQREIDCLKQKGEIAYVIPTGGSNYIGSWGYVQAIQEIADDLVNIGLDDGETTILSATGSGGTMAGLLLGKKMFNLDLDVVGVNVCDDEQYFLDEIGAICDKFCQEYDQIFSITREDIQVLDGYVGRGYALSKPEELQAIYDLARLEGVILDPVYTGKAYYGMVSELAKNRDRFGKRIVFIHTGGLFGLFPVAHQLAECF